MKIKISHLFLTLMILAGLILIYLDDLFKSFIGVVIVVLSIHTIFKIDERKRQFLKAILFFTFLIFLGFFLNSVVRYTNGCMMPVYTDKPLPEIYDNTHFIFTNSSEINYYYLSDIIPINFLKGFISVGDICYYAGLIMSFISLILYILNYYWGLEKIYERN